MGYKLLVTPYQGKIVSALYDGKRMVQVTADERQDSAVCLGGIYVGRVNNIAANINAAFVELAPGVMGYLFLGGKILPITANTHADGKIHVGDELVVQMEREAVKSKLASVTCAINLTGKYAVLVHGKEEVGISSKIVDQEMRARLREFFLQHMGGGFGFIVRTNAVSATEEELFKEIESLIMRYEKLCKNGVHRTRFSVLEGALPAYLCNLRDQYSNFLDGIITDDIVLHQEMEAYLKEYQPEDINKLKLYSDELPLKVLYSFEQRLKEALQKKVWLKSGATLVIEPTEALTVIDVNTGKAVKGRARGEEHFLEINLEAAREIASQVRLRNLSGIILVDFIDMEREESDAVLLRALKEYLSADPVKTTLVDMTPLHLVEITRKKVRRPLHEEGFERILGNGKNECDASACAGGD